MDHGWTQTAATWLPIAKPRSSGIGHTILQAMLDHERRPHLRIFWVGVGELDLHKNVKFQKGVFFRVENISETP